MKPIRILYVPQFGDSPVDPTVRASVAAAAGTFAELGHSVEEGKAPFAIEPLAPAWGVIGQVGLAWLLNSKPGWQGKHHLGPRRNGSQRQSQNRSGILCRLEYFQRAGAISFAFLP